MSDNLFLLEEAVTIWIKARESLLEAELLLSSHLYSGSAARSYYAAFQMTELLLLTIGKSFKRHEQVLGEFNRRFVNELHAFPAATKAILARLGAARHEADYDRMVITDEATAKRCNEDANDFVLSVETYLQSNFADITHEMMLRYPHRSDTARQDTGKSLGDLT